MLNTFITSYKLKNTYRVNSIIYSIKGLPIIHKIISNDLYKSSGLKIFAHIISILWEIISTLLGKFLYLFLLIFLMTMIYKTNSANTFLHIFTLLTIVGGILNTYMFNPTKDKYYAMILMKMDARKYTIPNYIYTLLKVWIGFLPFTIFFGITAKLPIWLCMIMPIFVVMIKSIAIYYNIQKYQRKGIVSNENLPDKVLWITVAFLLLLAYGLPLIEITINLPIFMGLFVASVILGIYSFLQTIQFEEFKRLYQMLLTRDYVYATSNINSTEMIKDSIANKIEYNEKTMSDKHGFAYFHELFIKRHSKILTKSAKKQAFIISLIIVIMIIITYMIPEIKPKLHHFILTSFPYFVFIMYLLNRGTTITQAMFMNCDHSMLTFRIYRTSKVILGVFKERLKTLISINLLPSSLLGLGVAFLLYLTGGTENILHCVILFVSINAMSIFFSIHYLVMYYLLQPYNVHTELKNSTYKVVQSLTYFVCYMMIQIHFPMLIFGFATIIFSILYSMISLFLIYKLAPKTFKVRL